MEIKEVRNRDINNKGDNEKENADDTKNGKDYMESCVVLYAINFYFFWKFFNLFFITFENKCCHMSCFVDTVLHTV